MPYHVIVIEPPTPVMTADDVRAVVPALAAVADGVIEGLIAAATAEIDGPAGWLGRAIGLQTLELQRCDFPCAAGWIRLPYPPLSNIEQVAYDDTDGSEAVIEPAEYQQRGNSLALKPGYHWPPVSGGLGAVRIQYVAGYPEGEIPGSILTAIQLRVSTLYSAISSQPGLKKEVVDSVGSFEWSVGSDGETATDRAVSSLLAPFRVTGV